MDTYREKRLRMIGVTNFYGMVTKGKVYKGRLNSSGTVYFTTDENTNGSLMYRTLKGEGVLKMLPSELNNNTKTI